MPQKPLSEMSHESGKMSEQSDYILSEVKLAVSEISKKLEGKLDLSDVQPLIDIVTEINQYKTGDLCEAVNILANKFDKLSAAMVELAKKLDENEVIGLDDDYEESFKNNL